MESYFMFKNLAIILVAAKICGIAARKCKAPQVVGEIIAGLLIGPSLLGWVEQSDFLVQLAEVGVVLLMFSAGLETDLKDLMKTGPIAALIACTGVFIPLVCGALLYMAFYGFAPWGSEEFYKAVFVGTILTATSVSITVESLKEMGKLKGTVGTTILSAAIIDDIIGIIVLTFVIGFKSPESKPVTVLVNTICVFCVCNCDWFSLLQAVSVHRQQVSAHKTYSNHGTCALLCDGVYRRKIFWYCGYHRRICSWHYPLLNP